MYRVGNFKEIMDMPGVLPEAVKQRLYESIYMLDLAYSRERDYLCTGGYCLVAQTEADVAEINSIINLEEHPCEWADRIGDYLSALYLMNDDYSIVVFMPINIAPKTLLEELED